MRAVENMRFGNLQALEARDSAARPPVFRRGRTGSGSTELKPATVTEIRRRTNDLLAKADECVARQNPRDAQPDRIDDAMPVWRSPSLNGHTNIMETAPPAHDPCDVSISHVTMKVSSSGLAGVNPRSNQWRLLAIVLGGALLVLFIQSFEPTKVLFANDGPLGALAAECNRLPARFTGTWRGLALSSAEPAPVAAPTFLHDSGDDSPSAALP